MDGSSTAGGGSFAMDLSIPMPVMQLQNLGHMGYAYGSYEDSKYSPMQLQNLGTLRTRPMQLQNLGHMGYAYGSYEDSKYSPMQL